MKFISQITTAVVVVVALQAQRAVEGCTAMAFSKGATKINAPFVMHSADCSECDTRVALVPGRSHGPNETKAVYGMIAEYPRRSSSRAAIYEKTPDIHKVLARIPEARYTFGLFEATYGLINEFGLVVGESTADSKISAGGIDQPDPKTKEKGTALLSIQMLIELGLERCKSATCMIKTMGLLAEEYGFQGEGFMTGEVLTIGCPVTGDSWVFHIMQDYSTNSSAIWAAQRVPEGHVSVVANEFNIKTIPQHPHEDYMHSHNLFSEAIAAGFWDGRGEFSFIDVYATTSLPTYGSVRIWGIYNIVAPSLQLEYVESPFDYPFSVPVDKKLSIEDALNLYRTHYENTPFDMRKGILAGPFENPNRVEGGKPSRNGRFTRGISIARTAHTQLGIAAPNGKAVSFFGTDAPASSVFVPFLAKTLQEARHMPLEDTLSLYDKSYQVGHKGEVSEESAWWAFDLTANHMNHNYQNMSQEYVYPSVAKWQKEMVEAYLEGTTEAATEAQKRVVEFWWDQYKMLLVRYNDDGFNFGPNAAKTFSTFGYTADYLNSFGYDKSFYRAITFQDQIDKALVEQCPSVIKIADYTNTIYILIPSAIAFVVGCFFGRRSSATVQLQQTEPYYIKL